MEKKPAFHIPSLDGFRTIAFLIVFLSHAGWEKFVPGGFGVTIFFFLSGYLITTLLRREHEATGTISFKDFYVRRMVRIWPAFYVVLGLGCLAVVTGLLAGELRWMPMLAQIFHLANYYQIYSGEGGAPPGTGVYWSLAVEEHFYLVFPLLYFVLLRTGCKARTQAWVLLGLCAAVLAWRCCLVYGFDANVLNDHRTFYATDTRVDSILFGCLLALVGNPMLDRKIGTDHVWKYALLPIGLALLVFALFYRDPAFRETTRYTLQGIGLIPVFVTAIRCPHWGPFRLLNLRPVAGLGVLTYPLYLVHYTVLVGVKAYMPLAGMKPAFALPVRAVVAFLIALALSMAIHRWVEQPVARWRKKRTVVNLGSAEDRDRSFHPG